MTTPNYSAASLAGPPLELDRDALLAAACDLPADQPC